MTESESTKKINNSTISQDLTQTQLDIVNESTPSTGCCMGVTLTQLGIDALITGSTYTILWFYFFV